MGRKTVNGAEKFDRTYIIKGLEYHVKRTELYWVTIIIIIVIIIITNTMMFNEHQGMKAEFRL